MSYKIAIDAGHGSDTAGKRTPPMPSNIDIDKDGKTDVKKGEQFREHYGNVLVADALNKALIRCGFITLKSAWDDVNYKDDADVALSTRQKLIKSVGCDASVSIHYNAYGDGKTFNTAEGIETLIHSSDVNVGDSKKLADLVQKYLILGTKQKNRGVKRMELAMCNCKVMGTKASILVELGFMTNKAEALLMTDEDFIQECAEEICQGFCAYFGVKYISAISQAQTPFLIKVVSDKLAIRNTPAVTAKINGYITNKGTYTIVEELNGYGKLKSGAGWIDLSFQKKV